MKKLFGFSLFVTIASIAVFVQPAQAQDMKKEIGAFTKKFEDAYNKKDDKALKAMYTDDAVRTDASGATITGNENIRASMADSWANSKVTLTIKQEKADKQADGTVITSGTYHVDGTAGSGEKIDVNGTYTNTLAKDAGKWKISKMVLGTM